MIRRIMLSLGLLLLLGAAPSQLPAQASAPATVEMQSGQASPAASAPTQDGFRAVQAQQAAERTMRGYWHLFIAFAVTWLVLFGYVISLGRRFGRLEAELNRLA
jgi:CcmD family protein